ncbi:cysteine protease ATG4C [Xenopus tropicalis]|uniref:Cysteine protease ATG4C n=2 Tax=Xenopus tropicalis TaxID=8364 RepID=ATG4C_XENTR|nr:cysteine protease ATG4C [Xenopus tropicalis]Q68EP9.1 RecName: Full=Cysteine protease ATG4C; AltName: Full=Autophagy-related protein 4 homolog C [Xenopus tropicalis]AAH80152.1 apg4c protein [Xenopus tropicalis]CAJ81923.1 APG4 autophagy 4 homolog C (S. cerevisiae) [Xenopus tropicalis]|eukprot:NP_001007883.1 cysteine protease ATG4C [Xenopus tropicalis]
MEASGTDDVEKLKSKFLSAWHNMKYSWVLKTKTYFKRNSPVFLLGKCYHFKYEDSSVTSDGGSNSGSESKEDLSGNVDEFRKDFISRIWLTYREEFPQIETSSWTTDCGWGCTLRTGQMLLAQGLIVHFLGRDWTWTEALDIFSSESEFWTANTARKLTPSLETSFSENNECVSSNKQPLHNCDKKSNSEDFHQKIISWFADYPLAYFGLHQLVKLGKNSGKVAGDWYGPAVVSHLLRKAIEESSDPELQGITIYVAQDCTIYSADVYDLQCNKGTEKAVVILVPVRLGGERTNMEYFEFVKGILSLEFCIGIIGGKPKQSYYFVGFQDDSLIYMDPHYCQSFVDVSVKNFPLESFHCPSPKKMSFKKMDPSCTIGFYCRNAREFEKAAEELTKVLKSSTKQNYPLFTFVNGHAQDFDFVCTPVYDQNDLFTEDEKKRLKRFSTEEFVLL